ncbi:hypothetical protein BC567DRAFT_233173 [Phyllosticta citribraziliensis]
MPGEHSVCLPERESGVRRNVDDTDMATGRQTKRERTESEPRQNARRQTPKTKRDASRRGGYPSAGKKGNQEQVPTEAQTGARARQPEPLHPNKGMRHCFD